MASLSLNRTLAIALLILAGVGAAAVWVATDVATRLSAATGVAAESADVLDESIDTADEVISSIGAGLGGADLIVADISASTELTAGVIDDASLLLRTDVADSIESIERTMPGLIEAGSVIDNTLSALAFFGVSYNSAVPFGEALSDVEGSMAGLADELRAQGAGLGEIAGPVRRAGEETAALAMTLSDVQDALLDAQSQLAEYRSSTAGLRELADTTSVDVDLLSVLGKVLAVAWALTGGLGAAATWRRAA